MRALICSAFAPLDDVQPGQLPTPEIGPDQVLIRVAAAGVNFYDTLIVQGKYQIKPPLPFAPGGESGGTVAAVGPGVSHVKPGDRVVAFSHYGAFAEFCRAPASQVFPLPALSLLTARRHTADQASSVADTVVEEVPVALIYNGISHAVMLATPADLEEFALGFSLSERLIACPADLRDIEIVPGQLGIEIRMEISARAFHGFKAGRRQLAGRTGCGLCGQESLEQAILPIPPVAQQLSVPAGALARAIAQLPERQILHQASGGVHAAAWSGADGEILLLREDIGRHNALDKLIGALRQRRIDLAGGFVVITSRASHELVYKAAHSGIELLAAVSAPTALAVRNAEIAGLTLVGWLRRESFSIYTGKQRIVP